MESVQSRYSLYVSMIKVGDCISPSHVFDAHRWQKFEDKTGMRVASADLGKRTIDISWLPEAAKKLCISADINDYVINEIPIVAIDLPNRNLDCFTKEDCNSYNVEQGKLTYSTFVGKPTFQEHANTDPTKAKGVHFASEIKQDPKTGIYHIVVLAGWDRTKDRKVTDAIENKDRVASFSMGAFVDHTGCSHPDCSETSSTGHIMCAHHKNGSAKGSITGDGHLVYECCFNTNFIETSLVEDPAQFDAYQVWQEPFLARTASVNAAKWLPSRLC